MASKGCSQMLPFHSFLQYLCTPPDCISFTVELYFFDIFSCICAHLTAVQSLLTCRPISEKGIFPVVFDVAFHPCQNYPSLQTKQLKIICKINIQTQGSLESPLLALITLTALSNLDQELYKWMLMTSNI